MAAAEDSIMNPSDEPQLKYEPLTGDVPTILQHEQITCLCLSDKILAIGTDAGVIHVLDYSGNQVKRLQHHRTPVNDLSFDSAGEHVASCSRDNCVVITSLYTDVSVKHDYGQPVQALALDPRYASRKSKEVAVVLGQTASVHLSSQGWLGRSDTVLSKGPGTQLVRWWGPLIAWITGGAVMVYSTIQHVLVRTFSRPTRGGAAAYSHASLLFGQNGWLYASWPDCVKVARTFSVENNIGGSTMQIEVVAEWTPHHLVLGVSPFGKDLAVLTFTAGWVPPSQPPVPGTAGTGGAQQQQEQQEQGEEQEQGPSRSQTPDAAAGLQLRIMGLQGAELACDSLDVGPLPTLLPGGTTRSYTLVPSLPATTLAATASKRLRQRPSSSGHPTTIASFAATGLDAAYGIPPPLPVQPQPLLAAQGVAHHAIPAVAAGGQGKPPRQPAQLTAQQARAAAIAAATAEQETGQKPSPPKPGSARSSAGGSSQPAATAAAGATTSQPPAFDSSLPVASATTSQPSSTTPASPPKATTTASTPVQPHSSSTATGAASPSPTAPPSTLHVPVTSTLPGGCPTPASTPRHLSRSTSQALDASDQHPAYEPDAEFMYFVTTPQGVLVGRMRDLSDHSQWLLGQGRFAEALELQEKRPREIRPEVQEEVVQGYIGYLLGNSLWDEAAQLSRRLLRQDVEMWERWAYMFAQARQLPKLARLLPTDAPRLRSQVYDMVLTSLLAHASDHATALELAQRWPAGCYSAPGLVDAVVGRMKRGGAGGDTRELWLLLSHLYEGQGRPDLALTILLQQQDPSAFTFIASHHEGLLAGLNGKRLTQLVSLDPARAIRLLVRHVDVVPPSSVVPGLQDAMSDAVDDMERDRWRRLMWSYLAAVHDTDPSAAQQYHELQVSLTADYAPGKLLELLSSSSAVPLEAALAICEDKGLVAEQVFILGRMGNSLRALHLIIDRLADIPQAIQFVQGQGDEELWEQLINWALSSPETTGSLLDHIGGHLNPLSLVKRIPRGLIIPSLRDRIRSIIADFRTQTSLREGCNVILRSDCARLAMRLHHAAAAAVGTVYLAPALTGGKTANYQPPVGGAVRSAEWARYDLATASIHPLASAQELPPGVAQAETALLELKEVPGPPTGMVPAGAAAKAPPPQPHSRVWVGCLPAVSSEDALGPGVGQGWPVDVPAAPPGRTLKPSIHPYGSAASRRRQQAAGHQQQQHATKALRQQADAQALTKENLMSLVM